MRLTPGGEARWRNDVTPVHCKMTFCCAVLLKNANWFSSGYNLNVFAKQNDLTSAALTEGLGRCV